jgi:DNA repair exonuclease SbcCD ATPase subunit
MILFEVIRWKNLLSTGNSWTEIWLNKSSTTLIIGKNGHGKSTIIDAICYALFGSPFRKINLELLINSINLANTRVELEFSIGNKKYKVIRGMRPQTFEVYENGILLNQDASLRDYQKNLEKNILGFNMKSFTQVVVIGSNSFTPFMRLGPQDRRAIIENLLDIEVFSSMNIIVKKKVKDNNDIIKSSKSKIEGLVDKIALQEKFINDKKKDHQKIIDERQVSHDSIKVEISVLKKSAHDIQLDINTLLGKINGETIIRENARKLESFRTKIEAKINGLETENKFFETHNDCPKCHQPLSNKKAVCDHNDNELVTLRQGLGQLFTKQHQVETQINVLKDIQAKINKRQLELREIQTRISEKQHSVDGIAAKIQELKDAAKTTITDDLLKAKQDLETELKKIINERNEALETKTYLDAAVVLLRDEGIKAKIVKQYLPVINKLANKYLSELDFFADFHLDGEFNETIKSRHRDKFSYESFSEGQKRRIDLSLLFTWRAVAKLKNSVNTNLLILDEILDGSLDDDGMEEFMKLLNTFGNGTNNFVISHRGDMLADKFDNVLKFKMSGLFSEAVIA